MLMLAVAHPSVLVKLDVIVNALYIILHLGY